MATESSFSRPEIVAPEELKALVERLHQNASPEGTTTADVAASLGMDEAQVRTALLSLRNERTVAPERRASRRRRILVAASVSAILFGGFLFAKARVSTVEPPDAAFAADAITVTPARKGEPAQEEAVANAVVNVSGTESVSASASAIQGEARAVSTEDLLRKLQDQLPRGMRLRVAHREVLGASTSGVFPESDVLQTIVALERTLGTPASRSGTISESRIREELSRPSPAAVTGLGVMHLEASAGDSSFERWIPRKAEGVTYPGSIRPMIDKVREARLEEIGKRLSEIAREAMTRGS